MQDPDKGLYFDPGRDLSGFFLLPKMKSSLLNIYKGLTKLGCECYLRS